MTQVDFYVVPDSGSAVTTACALCEAAAAGGTRLYVRVADPGLADELDGALWSWRQGGFLPHERHSGAPLAEPLPAVLIGGAEPPDSHRGVLLNLADDVPAWFSSFDRAIELVPTDPDAKVRSRERFRWYKDRGYPLSTYESDHEGGWKKRA
ncbi:MAG TPA: DNA polymerase III subunit chi [Nevskiaceae bacterium]|nr:DNA polymerase III subunit chi [Nevskiaceae bacterium]